MMKKLILFWIIIITAVSCTTVPEPEITVDLQSEVTQYQDRIDGLRQQNYAYHMKVDSLYEEILTLKDSLAFLGSTTRIKKQIDFPDTLYYAGYAFDLTNDRIFQKFYYWYRAEIKFAYKYIPRTTKYFPVIEDILSEYGLDDDIKYLAVAESYLSPLAQSSAGATGFWQFMKSTAKYYDIEMNQFVDQRRDIFASTRAACEYLSWSLKALTNRGAPDVLLAICAFNSGLSNITKAIDEQGGKDFFSLIQRKSETDDYVWRTLVMKYIIENESNIFTKPFEKEPSIYESCSIVPLVLDGYYKLDGWAQAQGTVIREVWELNPWLKIYKRNNYTHSPVNDVVVSPGDFTVLVPKNSIPNADEIAHIERQFLEKNNGYFTEHVVKSGENLWVIASRYNTSVSSLMSINGLASTTIYPGQKLNLISLKTNPEKYYVVKKGDTLSSISSKLGVAYQKLIQVNDLKSKTSNGQNIVYIYPGQKLYY
ncbi:MAG: LysM peptidoglycan-binding domain-containing protein [Candidatus Celaenobacter antarcticus]|nr:LysM peptidoglycan-binding domain-containing protein [Candidatus Celaenobacter antarcticus]